MSCTTRDYREAIIDTLIAHGVEEYWFERRKKHAAAVVFRHRGFQRSIFHPTSGSDAMRGVHHSRKDTRRVLREIEEKFTQ